MMRNKEIDMWLEKLEKVKGNTPAAEGIRAAIKDDIAREKKLLTKPV
jgi:hypothetical protein